MMQYTVYHVIPRVLPRVAMGMGDAEWPADYGIVALVEAETPEDVFRLTQNDEKGWWLNDGVTADPNQRSTSVGDVIIEPGGQAYRVRQHDFEKLLLKFNNQTGLCDLS